MASNAKNLAEYLNNETTSATADIADGSITVAKLASSLDLSSKTVTLAAGVGDLDWTESVKTANFTAVAGKGYFVNTTSSAITVTLPSSPSVGNKVAIVDYAGTADTNNSSNRFFEANIFASRDNFSSNQMLARGLGNMYNSTNRTYITASAEGLFDVTNTSTHKVRFGYSTGNNVTISGTSYNLTYVTFIRLGDT